MASNLKQEHVSTKELARAVAANLGGNYHLYEIEDIIDHIATAIPSLVQQGYKVRLGNFGTFRARLRAESVVGGALGEKMKAAGKEAVSPAKAKLVFEPSIATKADVAKLAVAA